MAIINIIQANQWHKGSIPTYIILAFFNCLTQFTQKYPKVQAN